MDGQQRLTTITMILSVLRNALQKEGLSDLSNGIHRLIERPNIDNKPQYILSTESSFPYFQEYIQKFGKPDIKIEPGDEEKNIESTFNQITGMIQDSTNAIRNDTTISEDSKRERIKEKLVQIRDKILGLKLIFVDLDNEDDAYIIFETLNTRGKDLSVSDLVKSHLTKLLKPKNLKVDTPKLQWDRIIATIEGSVADIDMDGFLHHYWLSKHDYVTIKKLFKEVKRTVRKTNAQDFLNELENDARTYRRIHETAFGKWKGEEKTIREALDAFSLFRVKQQVPMVLSVMRDYRTGKLKKKEVERIITAIEKFHFIFTAVTSQRSSGGISQMYAASAKRLVSAPAKKERTAGAKEDKIDVLNELHNKLRGKVPSYQEFEANFKDIYFTTSYTKQRNLVKYILCRIDAYHNSALVIDYKSMTVEHLIPQSAVGKNGLGEKLVGQLGNLILVPPKLNNKLGNKSFGDKKALLSKCNVFLDDTIKNATVWEPSKINERTEYLAKLAYNTIWKL